MSGWRSDRLGGRWFIGSERTGCCEGVIYVDL
jgi:hypothetical protein